MPLRFALFLCLSLFAGFASTARAAEEGDVAEFSSEGYCLLAHDRVDPRYLAVYARRLGGKPDARTCRRLLGIADAQPPRAWDYRHRRPYAASAIRLSVAQMRMLSAAREPLATR